MKYNKNIPIVLVTIAAGGMIYGHSSGMIPRSALLTAKNRVAVSCQRVFKQYMTAIRGGYGVYKGKILHGPRWKNEEYRTFRESGKKEDGPEIDPLKIGELMVSAPGVKLEMPAEDTFVSRRVSRLNRTWLGKQVRGYARIYHGPRNVPRVALTFDSGTVGDDISLHHRLIDLLVRTKTPATFFLTGRFIETHPEIATRLSEIPLFELGNHSYRHPDMANLSLRRVRKELLETQRVLEKTTGVQGTLFRPPYGSENRRVVSAAAGLGLHTVLWDVDSQDYRTTVHSAKIGENIMTRARNGSIVLMHMNGERADTAVALGRVIGELRRRGFELVTVSTLMAGHDGQGKEDGHAGMSVEQDKEKVVYGLGY